MLFKKIILSCIRFAITSSSKMLVQNEVPVVKHNMLSQCHLPIIWKSNSRIVWLRL